MLRRFAPTSAGILLLALQSCSPNPRHLKLSETAAFVVPDSVGVAGASLGPNRELLLWTPTQRRVVWIRDSNRHDLTAAELVRPIAAAVLEGPLTTTYTSSGAVEVLDGAKGSLIRFDPSGSASTIRTIPSWAGAVQGARARSGWFALLPDSSSGHGYSVQFQSDSGGAPRRLVRLEGGHSARPKSVRIAGWGDSLIVTEVRSPYVSTVIASAGSEAHPLITPSTVPELSQTRYTWLSMPLLPVGRGFLQVFADAESDRRLFVTYGQDRRPIRTSFVDAPIGIIAARTAPDRLLGMRRVGRTEVVQYRWEWSN